MEKGWRPRRTIIFASWAAEEYGVIGSYEFVEDKQHKIRERMVGLLNLDTCSIGPIAVTQASPSLRDLLLNSYKNAYDLEADSSVHGSYYDYWLNWHNSDKNESEQMDLPDIPLLTPSSDHAAFNLQNGVPAIRLMFEEDTKKHKGLRGNPTYHTGYETFYLIDKLIDPEYKLHRLCVQTSTYILMEMADSLVLPYNLNQMAEAMATGLGNFKEDDDLMDLMKVYKLEALETLKIRVVPCRNTTPLWTSWTRP